MTGEEMERAIEFLLQGQANHEARLGELTDNVNQLTQKVDQLAQNVGQLAQQVADTNQIFQLHAETQTGFIQIVTQHIEAQGEVNASLRATINRMDARITHTDVRLDRLEALVERYIEGRGGQA